MIEIDYRVTVGYSSEQMFDLVADYNSYPEFIKSCVGASTKQAMDNKVLAELEMSVAGLKQAFSTYTQFFRPNLITMELAAGPFQHLKGQWVFTDLPEGGCTIELQMTYELNRALEFLIGAKFKNSMVKMVDAFIKRAETVYGAPEHAVSRQSH